MARSHFAEAGLADLIDLREGDLRETLVDVEGPVELVSVHNGRSSLCEPFRQVIQNMLDLGLTAQRIHQDLVAEHSFAGHYPSVRRFVRRRY